MGLPHFRRCATGEKGPVPFRERASNRHGTLLACTYGGNEGIHTARHKRFCPAHTTYHVVNRGNDRRVVFREALDYQRFLTLLARGQAIAPVQIFGYCIMPNHFHLLLKPATDTALSAYMQWVTGRYACDLRRETRTMGHGHVFQRRFWSVPVEGRLAFLSVLRYVEANPSRARLVETAESWEWSSLAERDRNICVVSSPLPFPLPPNWLTFVNTPQREGVLTEIRKSLLPKPGRPRTRPEHEPSAAAKS